MIVILIIDEEHHLFRINVKEPHEKYKSDTVEAEVNRALKSNCLDFAGLPEKTSFISYEIRGYKPSVIIRIVMLTIYIFSLQQPYPVRFLCKFSYHAISEEILMFANSLIAAKPVESLAKIIKFDPFFAHILYRDYSPQTQRKLLYRLQQYLENVHKVEAKYLTWRKQKMAEFALSTDSLQLPATLRRFFNGGKFFLPESIVTFLRTIHIQKSNLNALCDEIDTQAIPDELNGARDTQICNKLTHGHCSGLSASWLYAMFLGYQLGLKEKGGKPIKFSTDNIPFDDVDFFHTAVKNILEWDGTIKNLLVLNYPEYFERLLYYIFCLEAAYRCVSLLSDTQNRSFLLRNFFIANFSTAADVQTVLREILTEGALIEVKSCARYYHFMGIFFDGVKYFFYDPYLGDSVLSTINDLSEAVFNSLKLNSHTPHTNIAYFAVWEEASLPALKSYVSVFKAQKRLLRALEEPINLANYKVSPLNEAINFGTDLELNNPAFSMIEALLHFDNHGEKIDANFKDYDENSALDCAVNANSLETMELLLQNGSASPIIKEESLAAQINTLRYARTSTTIKRLDANYSDNIRETALIDANQVSHNDLDKHLGWKQHSI